jgi:hypothetical protein
MGDESERSVEDVFYSWRAPRQALEDIKELGSVFDARAEILARCRSGLLEAGAATFVRRGQSGEKTAKFVVVPTSVWRDHAPGMNDDFWKSGTLSWYSEKYNSDSSYSLFGVRFKPADLAIIRTDAGLDVQPENIAPESSPTEKRKTRHGLPGVREALLQRWYELFLEAYPGGSKSLAEQSARGMFPDHSVDRQKVRDLFGPGSKGRPLKNRDNQ